MCVCVLISSHKEASELIQQWKEDHSSAGGVSQPHLQVPPRAQSAVRHVTFSSERELGQSPWSQQVLPTVFSPGRENHVTRAGCHICSSNVARLPPQAKNVSHSLFLLHLYPPKRTFCHFTGSCHKVVSANQDRSPPKAPPKSTCLMCLLHFFALTIGRDFLYVSQNSSKLELAFLSCCNCTCFVFFKKNLTTSY